ncbi:hypothetical protein ACFQBY_10495 [Promicromonospora citrea]|uniref:Uncharacterized protein n=1 Tax=Promicromonospora citrea TaxID=43677 RepID=A0A8H9L2C4_9MICO|nr:hypothetical protein [Promicromonospora citrea]NNH51455.1 hypothetical protein [Promicromonospora citrea]GGM12374.1 hypothetical protein GCM10010102_05070 [Promicromonospora citrea]
MTTYAVIAYQSEQRWTLHAVGVPGAIARAALLDDAESALRELLSRLTAEDADTIAIDLAPMPGPWGFD